MTRGPTPSVNRPPYRPSPRSNSALTCSYAGRRTTRRGARNDVPPAVHSLWTPVWTQCGSVSTDRSHSRDLRVDGAPEVTGAARGRQLGEEERHGPCTPRPGDRLGPDPRAAGDQPVPSAERDAEPDPPAGPGRGHGGSRRPQRIHPDRARVADAAGSGRGAVGALRP